MLICNASLWDVEVCPCAACVRRRQGTSIAPPSATPTANCPARTSNALPSPKQTAAKTAAFESKAVSRTPLGPGAGVSYSDNFYPEQECDPDEDEDCEDDSDLYDNAMDED